MHKLDSTFVTLLIASLLAVAVFVSVERWQPALGIATTTKSTPPATTGALTDTAVAQSAPATRWAASAPGRVEPKGSEIRVGAQAAGVIVDVFAASNDRVAPGELIARIDEEDAVSRVAAAEAEAAVRRRERDEETVPKPQLDRRVAEDAVYLSERAVAKARSDVDLAFVAQKRSGASADETTKARAALKAARDKLDQDRANLRRIASTPNLALPTRLEASLQTARVDVALAEAALERTRVRAPIAGTILQLNARVGELAAASPEMALATIGDLSALRVRAEVEERDMSRIRAGQAAIVRSEAFPGREYTGKVAVIAQYVGSPRLASRGPRKPTDVEVLDVAVDLDGAAPLLPGMRVEVYFAPEATAETQRGTSAPATKAN